MTREFVVDFPIAFVPGADAAPNDREALQLRLKQARGEDHDGRWSSFGVVAETDVATAERIGERGFFHDTPENRLEAVEGGFNADLPVLLDLALLPTKLERLPSPEADLPAWLSGALGATDAASPDLWREDSWNATFVWQEHHLDPSIGGGVIKVGYRTVFSPPRNEIDRLKRRGLVSRTIVEALIENGLPVRFESDLEAFELGFAVGEQTYTCQVRPDDTATALSLTVIWSREIPDAARARLADVIAQIDDEVPVGGFEAVDDGVRYVHDIQVDQSLVSQSWVIETLRAGISVLHHYRPRLIAALAGTDENG
ncbi:MAG: hypothetical protein ACRDIY_22110 [Chloroflexota bacterium]